MAKPGYGKRSTPGQQPRTRHDFALLPTRERYVAGFVDHLPDGAAMSVKHLAKQLPLYGQQAISTALTALSVAGHLRRVRCPVGAGDETRWVFRTFWSRTARDNEWWNTYLTAEKATQTPQPKQTTSPTPNTPAAPAQTPPPLAQTPPSPPHRPSLSTQAPPAPATAPQTAPTWTSATWATSPEPPPAGPGTEEPPTWTATEAPCAWVATEDNPPPPPAPEAPTAAHQATKGPDTRRQAPEPTAVPPQHTPKQQPDTTPTLTPTPTEAPAATPHPTGTAPSPAYLALARLGHQDHRLTLSAHDCTTLEAQAAQWLDRGVSTDYLTNALTAGLPSTIDHPAGLIRHRLTDKLPPQLPTPDSAPPHTPTHRTLIECTTCGRPGPPQALPDGLCRPCRTTHTTEAPVQPADTTDIKTRMANLRDLLKPV
ncbi:MarR family transcriptional regulator [Kitasatospora albolonga]